MKSIKVTKILSIAGSDSGAGAGVQADLKTFAALGAYGTSVITAVTAQNTLGVTDLHPIPSSNVSSQIEAVLSDIGTDGIDNDGDYSGSLPLLTDQDFEEEIINILQDKGEPMRIDEIMKALDIKGIPLPGSGTPANVTVRIRRATNDDGTKVFNRTNPGTYALNEDTPRWKKYKPLKDVRKRKKSRK